MANEPILRIKQADGTLRDISVEQLCVSNHLTYQALVTVLVRKGIISQKELLDEVTRVQKMQLGEDA
ncbi:hypothetical protein J7L01_04370 [bacterium]|nr:hypothetical protein [bacterium]